MFENQTPNLFQSIVRWVRSRANALRRSVEELDRLSLALAVSQLVLVAAGFTGFLLQSIWTPFFVVLFLLVSGLGWALRQALTAKVVTFLMTLTALLTLGLIAVFLVLESRLAFQTVGLDLINPFGENSWESSQGKYSLVPMMWGTVLTTIVATLVAGPLGIAGALFISEIAPAWLRDVVKPAVEVLAGIPSIVYGFIGFTIINPYVTDRLSVNPGAMFAIGVVIGFMALPTVISVAEDALAAVPSSMKDGSLAMGATDWQTMGSVTLPAAFSGVSAAVLLGIGRAMGETMAATVMISHSRRLPEPAGFNVFDSTETLTTFVASSYGHVTPGKLFWSALFAAGVLLMLTVTGLGIASQLVEQRMQRKLGGNQ
jgi:phosphate transport system permease protein